MLAAVMPRPLTPDLGAAADVVQSGMQTPPTLEHPVQPLLVMQAYPGPQSADEEQLGTSSQYEFWPQIAVSSVVVKQ